MGKSENLPMDEHICLDQGKLKESVKEEWVKGHNEFLEIWEKINFSPIFDVWPWEEALLGNFDFLRNIFHAICLDFGLAKFNRIIKWISSKLNLFLDLFSGNGDGKEDFGTWKLYI